MKWIKKGIILSESIAYENGIINPQVPYAILHKKYIRIFFGARYKKDLSSAASIFCIDVDINNPNKIIKIHNQPILIKGDLGCFDEDGVLPVAIKQFNGKLYLYYGGFTKCTSHPHYCMMGLAISNTTGNKFKKYSIGPILPISKIDPFLIGSADVMKFKKKYHMIYTSGTNWIKTENSFELCYSLKYANSNDGINWLPTGDFCIENNNLKYALAKPSLFKIKDTFYMIYSKRSTDNYRRKGKGTYRLLTAKSNDLKNWVNTNEIENINPTKEGWDSEMICYPNVLKIGNRYLLFYNGNGFGKTGFGYAELEI